jgi:hypothetical protein
MLFQALFMSLLSFKLSKVVNLFELFICYCFPTSSSHSFLRLTLSSSNICAACLHTDNISLIYATTREWLVSQSARLKLRTFSMLECHLLSINMWSIWLWVFSSGEVQVYLWMWQNSLFYHHYHYSPSVDSHAQFSV